MISDQLWDQHISGVHVDCKPARGKHGDGSWRKCTNAGEVERFHDHGFEGPLVCGCDDFGT